MPTFAYKGRNTGGQLIEGVLDGASASAVVDLLLGQGLTPVEIKESKAKTTKSSSGLNVTLFKQKVSHIDLLLFSRQMHTLLKSGVPIMRALSGFLGRGRAVCQQQAYFSFSTQTPSQDSGGSAMSFSQRCW